MQTRRAFRSLVAALFIQMMAAAVHGSASVPVSNAPDISSKVEFQHDVLSCDAAESFAVLTTKATDNSDYKPVLSVTSVMDVSSSMALHNAMPLMQQANVFILRELFNSDRPHKFGAVTFDGMATELVPLLPVESVDIDEVNDQIYALYPVGPTNFTGGLRMGIQQQLDDQEADPEGCHNIRVVLVFSDGEATQGVTDNDEILDIVRDMTGDETSVRVYTYRFGKKETHELMREIANTAHGMMVHIRTSHDLAATIGVTIGGLLSQVAFQLQYSVNPVDGSEILSVHGPGSVTGDGEEKRIMITGLEAGETREVAIIFRMPAGCKMQNFFNIRGDFYRTPCSPSVTDHPEIHPPRRSQDFTGDITNVEMEAKKSREHVLSEFQNELYDCEENSLETLEATVDTLIENIKAFNFDIMGTWLQDVFTDLKTIKKEIQGPWSKVENICEELFDMMTAIDKQQAVGATENLQSISKLVTNEQRRVENSAELEISYKHDISPFTFLLSHSASGVYGKGSAQKEKGGLQKEKGAVQKAEVMFVVKGQGPGPKPASISISLVMDFSDAMDKKTIIMMKKSAKRLIQFFSKRPEIEVSLGIITFTDTVNEIQSLKKHSALDKPALLKAIENAPTGGKGFVDEALFKGLTQQRFSSYYGSQTVFLISNSPSANRTELMERLEHKIEHAIFPVNVYTFGYMRSVHANMMYDIAEIGYGQRYVFYQPAHIPKCIGDAVGGLLVIAGKDIEVKFEPAGPGIRIENIFPSEGVDKGRNIATFRNIFGHEVQGYLTTLVIEPDLDPEWLLDITVTYNNATSDGTAESETVRIGSGKKSPTMMDQKKANMKIAQILTPAITKCHHDSDVTEILELINEALAVVSRKSIVVNGFAFYASKVAGDLKSIRRIITSSKSAKPGERDCSKLEAIVDLMKTTRSKVAGFKLLSIQDFFDSPVRRQCRVSMSWGLNSQEQCTQLALGTQKLMAQISVSVRNGKEARNGGAEHVTSKTLLSVGMGEELQEETIRDRWTVFLTVTDSMSKTVDAINLDDYITAVNEMSSILRSLEACPSRNDPMISEFILKLTDMANGLLDEINIGCDKSIEMTAAKNRKVMGQESSWDGRMRYHSEV